MITTFDAVHDQGDPSALLRGIRRALRPDGVYLMQDIAASSHVHENLDHPLGTLLYTASTMHCMTVSIAQGGAGLGTMWGDQVARDARRGRVRPDPVAHPRPRPVQRLLRHPP